MAKRIRLGFPSPFKPWRPQAKTLTLIAVIREIMARRKRQGIETTARGVKYDQLPTGV